MNTATITAAEAHAKILAAAETQNNAVRDCSDLMPGEIAHQGDVYLLRLAKKPAGYSKPYPGRQLAPGTTQGSRHVITDGPSLFSNPKITDPLLGPVIVADEPFMLTHPEHAHHRLPAGCYQVGYQLDVSEIERRAVRD